MRDVSDLENVMIDFDVPKDVQTFVLAYKVSKKLYELWIFIFMAMMVVFVFLGWAVPVLLVPDQQISACFDHVPVATLLFAGPLLFTGLIGSFILGTHLNLRMSEKHWLSMFAFGLLNEQSDAFSLKAIEHQNSMRPTEDNPTAYIKRYLNTWTLFAWRVIWFLVALSVIGFFWLQTSC